MVTANTPIFTTLDISFKKVPYVVNRSYYLFSGKSSRKHSKYPFFAKSSVLVWLSGTPLIWDILLYDEQFEKLHSTVVAF